VRTSRLHNNLDYEHNNLYYKYNYEHNDFYNKYDYEHYNYNHHSTSTASCIDSAGCARFPKRPAEL